MQQASLGAAPRPRIGREQLLRADFPQAQYRGLLPLNARLLTCRHVERLRLGRSENPSVAIHNAIVVTRSSEVSGNFPTSRSRGSFSAALISSRARGRGSRGTPQPVDLT